MAKTLLIMEDDSNIRELLRLYLEQEGYTIETATDGAEGMRAFKRIHPDLVLLDVMMPQMDGWQVIKEIRASSKTPVIMLTAKSETFDKVSGLELGADDYITKPFSMRELLARVKANIRRNEMVSAAAGATDSARPPDTGTGVSCSSNDGGCTVT